MASTLPTLNYSSSSLIYADFSIYDIESDADKAAVFEFMQKHFRYDEPITRALGATEEDTKDFYGDLCQHGFSQPGCSLIARHKASGELAGIALNAVSEMSATVETGNAGEEKEKVEFGKEILAGPYKSMNANRLIVFIEHIERGLVRYIDPCSDQGTHRVFKLDVLAVKATFHGRGLGSELVRRSLTKAREMQCEWVATCASARASNHIFTKFGLRTIRSIVFEKFLQDGRPVYTKLHDGGTAGELMILKLGSGDSSTTDGNNDTS